MLSNDLKQQIIDLEEENMASFLESVGYKFDRSELLENLSTEQSIVTVIRGSELVGLVRYKIQEGSCAFILSIQIKKPSKNKDVLFSFLKKTMKKLQEDQIEKLVSVVQKSNEKSIKFNQKIGLKVEKEFELAIRFTASVSELKSKLRL